MMNGRLKLGQFLVHVLLRLFVDHIVGGRRLVTRPARAAGLSKTGGGLDVGAG